MAAFSMSDVFPETDQVIAHQCRPRLPREGRIPSWRQATADRQVALPRPSLLPPPKPPPGEPGSPLQLAGLRFVQL